MNQKKIKELRRFFRSQSASYNPLPAPAYTTNKLTKFFSIGAPQLGGGYKVPYTTCTVNIPAKHAWRVFKRLMYSTSSATSNA